jgi:hypothetical protein
MQFEMLRLLMVERRQRGLFPRESPEGGAFTREAWLRDVFSREIEFQHLGGRFHYSPVTDHDAGPDVLVGRVGRLITRVENDVPERHLAVIERETWKAANILIDPTAHEDGQKAAMEYEPSVGHPVPVFQSLAAKINNDFEPFVLEVNAIVPSETFWNFVRDHEGQITSIQFEFIAPNMFGETDDYDAEMRTMHAEEKAQKAKLSLESKDGLNLNTKRIRTAAEHVLKGDGNVKARTKTKTSFDSKDRARKVNISTKEIDQIPAGSLISSLFNRIFKS